MNINDMFIHAYIVLPLDCDNNLIIQQIVSTIMLNDKLSNVKYHLMYFSFFKKLDMTVNFLFHMFIQCASRLYYYFLTNIMCKFISVVHSVV